MERRRTMSKGLDALKRYRFLPTAIDYDIIKKELKEHEQYKAIEEELGIDLLTLFKALKNGIWFINPVDNKLRYSMPIFDTSFEISLKGLTMLSTEIDMLFYFKDYGKTWALTKEELL